MCAKYEIRSTQKNAYSARKSKTHEVLLSDTAFEYFLMRALSIPVRVWCALPIVVWQCVQVEVVLLNPCPVTITRRTRTRYMAWMTVTDPIPCGCMKQHKAIAKPSVGHDFNASQNDTKWMKTSKTGYFLARI